MSSNINTNNNTGSASDVNENPQQTTTSSNQNTNIYDPNQQTPNIQNLNNNTNTNQNQFQNQNPPSLSNIPIIQVPRNTQVGVTPSTFGISLAPPLQGEPQQISPTENSNNQQSINQTDKSTLQDVQELLSILKSREGVQRFYTQFGIQGTSQEIPQQSTQQNQGQTMEKDTAEKVLVPSFNLDEFKGNRTHLFEFLQYLQRQKSLLLTLNIPEIQKKILLNSKLPSFVSNNMLTVVNDRNISLSQYIDQVAEFYGPKKEILRNQLMQSSPTKYENYISFIHRMQELAFFSQVSESQLLFILEYRLPKHIVGYIKECSTVQQYVSKLNLIQQEGWFGLIDDQYRKSIPPPKNREASRQEYTPNQNSGDQQKLQSETVQNSGPRTGVAFIGVENAFENYPAQTRTKGVKKTQHIDKQVPQQFQHQAQQDYDQYQQQQIRARQQQEQQRQQEQQQQQQQNQQQQQQQYQQQQQTQQNSNQQGTSNQHYQNGFDTSPVQGQGQGQQQQQRAVPEVDETIRKLLEKAKQNVAQDQTRQHNLPQINKGPRGKKVNNIQQYFEPETYTKPILLDPIRYTNQASQFNLTQALKEIFIPLNMGQYLNLTGLEITKKQNQQIPSNTAYYQSVQQVPGIQSQVLPNQQSSQVSQNVYNSQGQTVDEQALYEYFYNTLSQQEQPQQVIDQQINPAMYVQTLDEQEYFDHLCIPVLINKFLVSGITDSGAQQTIISLKVAQQAGIVDQIKRQNDAVESIHVYGCTGKDKILGIIPRLEVSIQGFEVSWKDILVQQSSPFDMLIGLDMLTMFDFQFQIKDRVVSFIPYPDDPRVKITLCDPVELQQINEQQSQGNKQQTVRVALASFIKIEPSVKSKQYDVVKYINQIDNLYPGFPIFKQYNLIYMDPAWLYQRPIFNTKPPYPCLNFKQLQALPIQAIANRSGCIILMWSTGTHLYQAMQLIYYWGFKYVNLFLVWRKVKKDFTGPSNGEGIFSRNVYEFLVMGTLGKIGRFRIKQSKESTVSQEFESILDVEQPRSKVFSRKPYQIYQSISKVFDLDQMQNIELFATERHSFNQKFDLYGNQLQPQFQKSQYFQKHPKNYYMSLKQKFCYTQGIQSSKMIMQCHIQGSKLIEQYCDNLNIGPGVPGEYIEKLKSLIKKYQDVYKFDNSLTYTNILEADIELKPNSKPVKMKPYKCIGESYKFLKSKFDAMEKDGLVIKGKSEWGTAVMTVPKDSPTEPFRAVQNFKRVNSVTKKDVYPLRRIEVILVKVGKKRWKVVVDLRGGFNQIRRTNSSREIMAMILPFGLYIPVVMWFGETNAPSIFQRAIDIAISDLYDNGVECYIDDIIIYADTLSELLKILEQLFERLRKSNFKLHPDKCTYFVQTATILGHEISYDQMSPKRKKIQKLQTAQIPQTKKQLQQFIGSVNYYRKFIPDLAMLLLPFQNSLSSQEKQFVWTGQQQLSFDTIMQHIKSNMVLQLPDLGKQFKIVISYTPYTYNTALIQQDDNGQEFACAFHSLHCVVNSNTVDMYLREIDCLVWALREWRPYVQHQQFIIQTDLKAMKHLYQSKSNNTKLLDYQLELQDLIFDIESIPVNRMRQMLLLTQFKNSSASVIENLESSYNQIQQSQSTDQQPKQKKGTNKGSDFSKFDYILQFDGASQLLKFGNQQGAGAYVIYNSQRQIIHEAQFQFPGAQTNNCAEYSALIEGLKFLIFKNYNKFRILIQGDSQLVILQVTYKYMCNSDNLSLLSQNARELLKRFSNVTIEHIDRSYNFECDTRAKQVLTKIKEKQSNTVHNYFADIGLEIDAIKCQVCDQTQPEENMMLCDHCNQGYHSDCINLQNIEIRDWYCEQCYEYIQEKNNSGSFVDPSEDLYLLQFLRNEMSQLYFNQLSTDVQQRITQRALIYKIQSEKLYKIDLDQNIREVPTVAERRVLIEQIHQLIGHLGINRTVSLIQEYYYWPKMQSQIIDQLRHCMLCSAQNPQYLHMPGVFPINKKFGPMQCLYFDCFYMPKSKKGNQLVVMAICGMTKWVEARAIPTNNSKFTRDFLFDDIICRYGCPITIRSDNGPEFLGNFRELCDNMGIIQFFSSPYYPQSNGQIERMNRTVKGCITKLANCYTVHDHYDWEDYLPQALMGIRFTVSRPTSFSPYQSLFGQDPVLPGYQSINRGVTFVFPNDQEQSEYVYNKIQYKQNIYPEIHQNLQNMEDEIEQVMRKRDPISPSNLEYGQLVFVKRESPVIYPKTKSKGPYIFIGYNDPEHTSAILINPTNSKIRNVNITKINPLRFY